MQRTLLSLALACTSLAHAASHREAPITALDHKADITDIYAFRSYDAGTPKVTMILGVDPLLEPSNGPNWFPFDPDISYEIKIDNNHDAVEDIGFEFRFQTEQRLPNVFQAYVGAGSGVNAPSNSPPPVTPGTAIIPPRITNFDDAGLGTRQTYTLTKITYNNGKPVARQILSEGAPRYAVPANVGPRTMDYVALFNAATYSLAGDVKSFAGTTDDPFWIDLGGAFDTFNTHIPPILSPAQDASPQNIASDMISGFAVNTLAIEVPVAMLTQTGSVELPSASAATIGIWGTTSRPGTTVRRGSWAGSVTSGPFRQVQRMGNPLINELLVGTGFKDRWSMDQPKNDKQFANFFLDPLIARVINAATAGAVAIPATPRTDLLPVVTYAPPIAAVGTPAGPIADLLRLNTGVPPTVAASRSRLGVLGGDNAGFPNGRRVGDDVTDIVLRLVVGGVLAAPFPGYSASIGGSLGDGVNSNDTPYLETFPYVGYAPSGRDRRHIDPGELGCTAGAGPACAP